MHGAPVLDATFADETTTLYSGGLDKILRQLDVASGAATPMGSHEGAIRCVEWLPGRGLVVTAAWDAALKLWDPRSGAPGAEAAIASIPHSGKAFSMSCTDTRLVVATSTRQVEVYDIRTLGPGVAPEQKRDSPLKHQTRCLRCFPSGAGFAISSIEGRVAMEYFDQAEEVQARKYAFKCHRKAEGGKDVIYPVNAIAFNATYGTFVTGGCDGVVNFWDGEHKKRLQQVAGYRTSVAALAFNHDASLLAVAASYTYERGEPAEKVADAIHVRQVTEVEVKPRQRQQV